MARTVEEILDLIAQKEAQIEELDSEISMLREEADVAAEGEESEEDDNDEDD